VILEPLEQADPPCPVCGLDPGGHCQCPECPQCGEAGNPDCLASHGLKFAAPCFTDVVRWLKMPSPVSHNDLRSAFVELYRRGVRHNLEGEPVWVSCMREAGFFSSRIEKKP
jgi:hypothetical protein